MSVTTETTRQEQVEQFSVSDAQTLRDRVAHAIVFAEATTRALQDALRIIDDGKAREEGDVA